MCIAFGVLVALSGVHLAGQLTGAATVADATQVLLMPAVAGLLLTGTRAPRVRLVRLALVALLLSWLGDSVPRLTAGDASFLLMVGFFLVAQLVYVAALWPYRHTSLLHRPAALVPYGAVGIVIVVLCAPQAGAMLPAVTVYAAAIVAMAVLATGLGRLAGAGAVVFVASDALIALDAFGVMTLPGQGFWVMSSYITAQTLLIMAVRRRAQQGPAQQSRAEPGPAEPGSGEQGSVR